MLWLLGSALAADFCAGFGGGPVPEFQVDPLAPPAADDTCWGQQYEHRAESEHFVLEWAADSITQQAASSWAERLEEAYATQVELGFREPYLHEQHKTLVVLTAQSGRSYVAGAECPDGEEVAFMVLETGDTPYPDALASHELNHVLQHAYLSGHELWFWEATATWAQTQNAPDEKEWALFIVSLGLMDAPWLGMRRSDRQTSAHDMHMYGMAGWLFFLEQEHGVETITALWEAAEDTGPEYSLAIQDAVAEAGLDFRELMQGFLLITAHDLYDESFSEVAQTAQVLSMPFEATVDGVGAPETQGMSFATVLPEAISAEHGDLLLRVEADPEGDWVGLISAERVEGGVEVHELDLSSGSAEVLILDLSTTRGATISMSPMAGELETWTWSWSGELTGDPPSDPRPGYRTFGGTPEGNCSTGGGLASGLLALMGAMVLRRYRRL